MSKKPCAECGTPTTWVRAINDSPICGPYEGCSKSQADGLPKSLLEPQEGAPSGASGRMTGGVPSCGSELADIRRFVEQDVRLGKPLTSTAYAATLLRMVDELTAERDELSTAVRIVDSAHRKERDDLRAKLAEAEKTIRDLNAEGLTWKYRAEVAEQKLKTTNLCIVWDAEYPREAELLTECRKQEERAEAAEARCRELEETWSDHKAVCGS